MKLSSAWAKIVLVCLLTGIVLAVFWPFLSRPDGVQSEFVGPLFRFVPWRVSVGILVLALVVIASYWRRKSRWARSDAR
jgi:hypothetical protein